jgi:hypothetical protein
MEGGIECAILDLEDLGGQVSDPFGDAESVHGSPGEGLEDHDVERALEEVEVRGVGRQDATLI